MTLGERIVALRKRSKMTQGELAEKLNVTRGAVSMWEINVRVPDLDKIVELANVFNVTVDYLLGRQGKFNIEFLPDKAQTDIANFIEYIKTQYNIPAQTQVSL